MSAGNWWESLSWTRIFCCTGRSLATGRGARHGPGAGGGPARSGCGGPADPAELRARGEGRDDLHFGAVDLGEGAHPNSAKLVLTAAGGKKLEVVGESVGGGRINIREIDGLEANFSGDLPTLIVHNLDQPGHVAEVTSMLQHKSVNIATMQLYRSGRGGHAVMVIECDQEVPEESVHWLEPSRGRGEGHLL